MYNVVKRDGKIVDFDLSKISTAITQAFNACQKQYNPDIIDFLALKVTANFEPKISNNLVAVEDVQDSVESVFIKAGYGDVAFRRLAKDYGAGLTVTEMISVKALENKSFKTEKMLREEANCIPICFPCWPMRSSGRTIWMDSARN